MQNSNNAKREAAEDIFYGQVVINWARWFIVAAGMVLILWTVEEKSQVVMGIVPIVAIMAINFYLHGRLLADRPANPALVGLTSAIDIGVITILVLFWSEQTGLASPFFILYYPVVLAFAFVMPPKVSIPFTVTTVALFAGVCVLAEPEILSSVTTVKALILRSITLAAMGGLAAYYWRTSLRRPAAKTVRSNGNGAQDSAAIA
ncbi:MAG: hypothetical protein QGG34_09785 [SAR202 cluster bacterium]|jgi:hypothetical protein|nr:hypothetical protein [SAR202 cluster bacterium]MDP7412718.1 hypothetical protein [SAR202 cluster bacterium]